MDFRDAYQTVVETLAAQPDDEPLGPWSSDEILGIVQAANKTVDDLFSDIERHQIEAAKLSFDEAIVQKKLDLLFSM